MFDNDYTNNGKFNAKSDARSVAWVVGADGKMIKLENKVRTFEEIKTDIELYKEAYPEDARPRRISWLEDIIDDLIKIIECQSQ